MSLLRQLWRGLSALLFPARADAEMDTEVRHFVDQRARELVRDGMPHHEAVRRAVAACIGQSARPNAPPRSRVSAM